MRYSIHVRETQRKRRRPLKRPLHRRAGRGVGRAYGSLSRTANSHDPSNRTKQRCRLHLLRYLFLCMRISVQRQVEGGVIVRAEMLLAQIERGVSSMPLKPSLALPPSSGVSSISPLLSPSPLQSPVSPRELCKNSYMISLFRSGLRRTQASLSHSSYSVTDLTMQYRCWPMVHKLELRTEGLGTHSPDGGILHTSPIPMTDEDDELPTPRVDKRKGRAELSLRNPKRCSTRVS